MYLLRNYWFLLFFISSLAIAEQHDEKTSRLLVGFHKNSYTSLGGALEATDFINSLWGDNKKVSLVRPLGNSTILVEIIDNDSSSLNTVIDSLSQTQEIRFVEKDQPVEFYPKPNTDIPSLN